MKISLSYRLPLGVSVFLHIILLIALIINVSTRNKYRYNDQNRQMPIINILTVDQQAFDNKIKMQQTEEQKCIIKKTCKEKLQKQVLFLKKQRIPEQKRLLFMRAKQLQLKQKQERKVSVRKKLLAIKKKQKILAKMQQRLQKKLLQQEIAQEKALFVTKAQQIAQIQGILNQYKEEIIQAIEQQWIVPINIDNKKLSCILLIRLAPGGNVLSVKTIRSSGNVVLDSSARMAVFKASPLPVPRNTIASSEFRELRLTVRPLQIK